MYDLAARCMERGEGPPGDRERFSTSVVRHKGCFIWLRGQELLADVHDNLYQVR
jgi:hypothetical protein